MVEALKDKKFSCFWTTASTILTADGVTRIKILSI